MIGFFRRRLLTIFAKQRTLDERGGFSHISLGEINIGVVFKLSVQIKIAILLKKSLLNIMH
jgi:hypothetical protein